MSPSAPAQLAGSAVNSPASSTNEQIEGALGPEALAETAAVVAVESLTLAESNKATDQANDDDKPPASSSTATSANSPTAFPPCSASSTPSSPPTEDEKPPPEPSTPHVLGGSKDFGFLPIPKRLRWDSHKEPHFGLLLNGLFGFAATFTVANLYYSQPILIVLSEKFNVSYDEVTNIPTFLQASYMLGLAFICPLGDLVRRRPLLLVIVATSAVLSLVLALVPSVAAFQAVSFFLGAASVTPQILLPLSGDLARPDRRASALSIVLSGLLLGILLARVLAGLIAEKASVAALYYMSFGLQVLIWFMIWSCVPDYPAKNPDLNYLDILWSMCKYMATEPVLVQASLITLCASAVFSAFWTSSTFLLGDVYGYNSLEIGLFALIGIVGVLLAPFIGRLIDSLVSWVGVFIGIAILLASQVIFTGAAGVNIGVLVVVILLLDIGMQLQQVSNSTRIFAINAAARARFSACFLVLNFAGQLIGTSAGTRVYLTWGYRASGGLCVGLTGFQMFMLFLRSPHLPNKRWIGWSGGWELRKSVVEREKREKEEKEKEVAKAEEV
ncbi:hypothetical protein JCM8547_003518 [Rhodosporidiobolus lusitaniae]